MVDALMVVKEDVDGMCTYLDRKRKSSCISSRMPLTSIFALPAQNKHRLSKSQRSDCRRNLPIPAHESWHCVRYDNKYMGIDIQ